MAGRRGRRLGSWACRILRWGGGLGRRVWDWRWGAVGARRPGGRPAQAGGVRGLGGRGRPGRGRVDPGRGQVVARYVYECPRPPRCRRRAPGMAVRSGVAGGAGAPCGHRITGDPTRGCRGGAGRGLRLGAAGAGHDHPRAWRRGTWAALIARQVRPVPADRVGRDPPRGRRGAGSTAPRRHRPRPGRGWPVPRSAGLDANPALRERVVDLLEDRVSPGQIAARLRFENPDDGGMRPCSRADPPRGPGAFRAPAGRAPSCGWRRPCAPDAPAAHLRSPLAGEARAQGQGAGYQGATHRSAPARGATRGPPAGTGRQTWSSAPAGAAP